MAFAKAGRTARVFDLFAAARDTGVHIHLIHHIKKLPKESDVPDKNNVKGTGAITDIVDNLFMVWRNKPKEDDAKANGARSNKQTEPDCYLLCRKQRNYEGSDDGEPIVSLWRHRDAGNYVAAAGDSAQFFPNYPHHPT